MTDPRVEGSEVTEMSAAQLCSCLLSAFINYVLLAHSHTHLLSHFFMAAFAGQPQWQCGIVVTEII